MKPVLIGLGLLLLAGCAVPASPAQITASLKRNYANRPANEFFYDYGDPSGEFEWTNDGHVWHWASVQPKGPVRLARYHSDYGEYEMADTYHGTIGRQYCEIRIYTDAEDT